MAAREQILDLKERMGRSIIGQEVIVERLLLTLVRPEYSCRPWKVLMMESLNDWEFDDLTQFG